MALIAAGVGVGACGGVGNAPSDPAQSPTGTTAPYGSTVDDEGYLDTVVPRSDPQTTAAPNPNAGGGAATP